MERTATGTVFRRILISAALMQVALTFAAVHIEEVSGRARTRLAFAFTCERVQFVVFGAIIIALWKTTTGFYVKVAVSRTCLLHTLARAVHWIQSKISRTMSLAFTGTNRSIESEIGLALFQAIA